MLRPTPAEVPAGPPPAPAAHAPMWNGKVEAIRPAPPLPPRALRRPPAPGGPKTSRLGVEQPSRARSRSRSSSGLAPGSDRGEKTGWMDSSGSRASSPLSSPAAAPSGPVMEMARPAAGSDASACFLPLPLPPEPAPPPEPPPLPLLLRWRLAEPPSAEASPLDPALRLPALPVGVLSPFASALSAAAAARLAELLRLRGALVGAALGAASAAGGGGGGGLGLSWARRFLRMVEL
mmetsp:Transcript_5252/g.15595  ORF Transcript_5252/g.15595 Transcript_5252/m.15595 type:complete len:235 (-) Transcript_5252:700-1404(-)